MSKISIKTDFADGEKLFAQQLNNNFLVIQEGINANEENLQEVIDQAIVELDNELEEITADRGWDWNGGDRVTFFKGTTSQVNAQEIENGQMLYNTETGETALDDNGNRIVTGSGNVVTVSNNAPTNPATKEWIKPITMNGAETAEEYFRDANNNWKKILYEPSGDTLPIGAITQFSGSIAPTNWLFCNGQAVSRTTYSELFAVIGTTYGEGDGSTTFNLPDFIGRVPVGLDAEDTDFDSLGDFGGEKTHTLTINEMPSHNHTFNFRFGSTPAFEGQQGAYLLAGTSNTTIAPTGGNQPHNIIQPYLVTNFIIKVKQSVGLLGTITTDITDTNVNAVPNASTVKTYVDNKNVYGPTEHVIGVTETGDPIYRKVFNVGNVAKETLTRINYAIPNLGQMIDLRGFNNIANSNFEVPINFFNIMQYRIGETPNGQHCFVNRGEQVIEFYSTWDVIDLVITMEYTKTTD